MNNSYKYNIIKSDIRKQINQHELNKNDKILSEAQLCQKYGVSRITATKAINDLVSEGYLYRIQGKGTFVNRLPISEEISQLCGFAERMKRQHLSLETKVLSCETVQMPSPMQAQFSLPFEMEVLLLKRLRIVNNEPLCISISYLIPSIFYWVNQESMETQSLFDLLENKYQHKLCNAIQELEVGYLSDEDAHHLSISSSDPCLKLTLFCYVDQNEPAMYEETYYLQGKYKYRLQLGSTKTLL